MHFMIERINEMSLSEKILYIIEIISCVVIIILGCMQLLGIFKKASSCYEPLLGVVLLIRGVRCWKCNKKESIAYIAAAMFTFVVVIKVMIMK